MSNNVENQFWGRSQKGGNNLAPANEIDKKLKENKIQVLSFPDDIGTHSFLMCFQAYNFEQKATELSNSIQLPMPSSIIDKYGMEYNQTDLKTAGAGAASATATGLKHIFQGGKDASMTLGEDTNFDEVAGAFLSSVEGVVRDLNPIDSLRGATDLALGNIVNPHTALLFSSVKLKEFEFGWKLYPRSANESKSIRTIINKLKQFSHPGYEEHGSAKAAKHGLGGISNFKLTYPCEVDLFYMGPVNEMHKFKRCAVTSLQVNYTPEGGPAFIAESGEPAFVELQIGFTETMIWTAEDFGDDVEHMGISKPETGIGFDDNGGGYG